MQYSALKKYITLSIVYLLVNILIFIFWWVVTDPSNYIWKDISDFKAHKIILACNKLFYIRYYVSFVLINCLVTAFILIHSKRMISISIMLFTVLFYVISTFLFDQYISKNYFVIFENQNVSKSFYLEPVLDAGKGICPILFEKLNDTPSFVREQSARGLGVLSYKVACDKLNQILNDSSESINMRAECYFALKKINTKESKLLLEQFSIQQQHVAIPDSTLIGRINFLETEDVY